MMVLVLFQKSEVRKETVSSLRDMAFNDWPEVQPATDFLRRKFIFTSLVGLHEKEGWASADWEQPLNVLKAPEITTSHLPTAPSLAQFSWGLQVSLTSPLLRNNLRTSFHSFPTPPNNGRAGPHQLWPFSSPPGTQVPSLRGVSGRDKELGNHGACLHPVPPRTHPEHLCSQPLSHKAVLCSTAAKLPTAWDLTFVLVFSCLPSWV